MTASNRVTEGSVCNPPCASEDWNDQHATADDIGIPSPLVILSWMQQSQRMARLESLVDGSRDLQSEMVALWDSIHRDMVGLHERVAIVEIRQQG